MLESGTTTPKSDKAAILTDAIRQVKLLREESSSLTRQNAELKQKNNELKVLSFMNGFDLSVKKKPIIHQQID